MPDHPHRVLIIPRWRLRLPGGLHFVEQELTRFSHGGYALIGGQSTVDPLPGFFENYRLRFVFTRIPESERPNTGDPDREYVVESVNIVGKPAGDPMIYAREATDKINERTRYGFKLVDQLIVSDRWYFVMERPIGHPVPGTRYEVISVERAKFDRTNPWPLGEDRELRAMVATPTHLFAIIVIPARQPGASRGSTKKFLKPEVPAEPGPQPPTGAETAEPALSGAPDAGKNPAPLSIPEKKDDTETGAKS